MERQRFENQIDSFRALKRNWDSYGAEPLRHSVVAAALAVLGAISGTSLKTLRITPSPDGSIVFDYRKTSSRVVIEVFSDDGIVVSTDTESAETNLADLPEALSKLEDAA